MMTNLEKAREWLIGTVPVEDREDAAKDVDLPQIAAALAGLLTEVEDAALERAETSIRTLTSRPGDYVYDCPTVGAAIRVIRALKSGGK